MDAQPDGVDRLDDALLILRHGQFGLYGPVVRETFFSGLPHGVSPTEYRVLRFIEASTPPPPTMSDIAALLLVDRARAARVVDKLAGRGLARRTPDALDRRTRRVELTTSARDHLAAATARRRQLLGQALADWSSHDLQTLATILERLNDAIARHAPWSSEETSTS